MTRTVHEIVYTVEGTGTPSISYGSDSNSVSVKGGMGTLGDGVQLPFRATQKVDGNALYYSSAQLENGGGHITATVKEKTARYYSNGDHRTISSKVEDTAHASGNYAIASPQFDPSTF